MRRMAADTGHRLARPRIDLVLERMVVRLFRILVTVHAEAINIRRAQESFVISRVNLVAVGTVLKSNFVLEFPFELPSIVASQAGCHAILIHQIRCKSGVRGVTIHTPILLRHRRMLDRLVQTRFHLGVAGETERFAGGDQLALASRLMALLTASGGKRRMSLR